MIQARGKMFPVSENIESAKNKKYVVTDGYSNQFCGIYKSVKDGTTKIIVPTLRETIECKINNLDLFSNTVFIDNDEFKLLFILSPLDLVYLPTKDEQLDPNSFTLSKWSEERTQRIYKFVDGNSNEVMNFIPYYIAKPLVNISKKEYKALGISKLKFLEKKQTKVNIIRKEKDLVNEIGLGSDQSKNQNSFESNYLNCISIKTNCWKIDVDRLGNITKITQYIP